jgi:multiple sugar transport system ATP-binding protein
VLGRDPRNHRRHEGLAVRRLRIRLGLRGRRDRADALARGGVRLVRGALRRRLVRSDAAIVWTSPDAAEALAVADRVAVLLGGRAQQVAPPAEIYRRPATVDVARLVGDPPMNLLEGALVEDAGALGFRHAAFGVRLPPAMRRRLEGHGRHDRVVLGLRPAEIRVAAAETDGARGEVWVWEPLGKHGILSVRVGSDVVKAKVAKDGNWAPGAAVALDMSATEPVLFDAATGSVL